MRTTLRSALEIEEVDVLRRTLEGIFRRRHGQESLVGINEISEDGQIAHDSLTTFSITIKGTVRYTKVKYHDG